MATCGDLVSWSGTLDCQYIVRSTCKITKAGIGGPLVNLDEEVLGMNFCDTRIGTPFLLWTDIDNILAHFREKSKAIEFGSDSVPSGAAFWKMHGDHSGLLNRWHVPMPCWCHREDVHKDKSEDELVSFDPQTGRKRRYGYIQGVKVELY